MPGKTHREQAMRVKIARSEYHAHLASFTAMNGYARFYDPTAAQLFAERIGEGNVAVYIFNQSNQTAVDWSVGNRYRNGNLADR